MSRLTEARIEAWDKRLSKAYGELEKVLSEQRAHATTAKGGRLSDLQSCVLKTRDASSSIYEALLTTAALKAGERRRKGRG